MRLSKCANEYEKTGTDSAKRRGNSFENPPALKASSKATILIPETGPTKEVELYTRNVRIKLRTDSVSEFRRILDQKVIPLLRTQRGFQDEITLFTSRLNEAIAISFWDNQENADAYNHVAYLDVLRALSKVIESVPIVESFEVVGSTFHENASAA